MKYDVITIGGATEDISVYTDQGLIVENKDDLLCQKMIAFEYGAKLRVKKTYATFGGGAANVAVNFSGLGLKTACLACLGKDERAKRVIKNLKAKKVKTKLIQKSRVNETGFSFILLTPEKIVFSSRGANNDLLLSNSDLRNIKKTKWTYLTSMGGAWKKELDKLFAIENLKLAWNPGHEQLLAGLAKLRKYLKKTEIFFVNKDEAIELALSDKKAKGKGKSFLNNKKNLLKIIKFYGPKIVVLTDGKNGADAFDGEKFYHQSILKETKKLDTTGVGDAFNSTFTAGLDMSGDVSRALLMGAKNTASVISEQGAQNGLLPLDRLI